MAPSSSYFRRLVLLLMISSTLAAKMAAEIGVLCCEIGRNTKPVTHDITNTEWGQLRSVILCLIKSFKRHEVVIYSYTLGDLRSIVNTMLVVVKLW